MKKACIVGYGKIGPNHADAFKNIENAELYAVCDVKEERIKKCQERFDVVGYTDFDEMLKDENVDTVHICTPHYLHFEMIVKALKAGKEVISEKPVTMTREQFEELKKIPGADNICLVFQNRFNACAVKLKEIISGGELGKIKAARAVLTWNRTAEYYLEDEWRGKWATEGGDILINQTMHTLDLLGHLVSNISTVQANMMNYSLQDVIEVEDTFVARLGFANGVGGFFVATNCHPVNSSVDFEIVFEKGIARYANDCLMVNEEIIARDEIAVAGKKYWGASHTKLLKNYYDHGIYIHIKDVENTMYTLYSLYESAKENGKKINIF